MIFAWAFTALTLKGTLASENTMRPTHSVLPEIAYARNAENTEDQDMRLIEATSYRNETGTTHLQRTRGQRE